MLLSICLIILMLLCWGHKWQIEELKHSRIKSMQFQNCNINKSFIIIKRKREILSDAAKIFLEIINDNYADM